MLAFPHVLRLTFAGILALPALILLVVVSPVVALLSIPSLAILVRRKRSFSPSFSPPRSCSTNDNRPDGAAAAATLEHPLLQHAVITGGSSGIGLSIALDLAKRGCRHITLLARKEGQLAEAKRSVEEAIAATVNKATTTTTTTTIVRVVSVDVTDYAALEKEVKILCVDDDDANNATNNNSPGPGPGPPTLLFNCAGYSIPLAFEDLSVSDFSAQVNVNYLGSIHVVKAFLPYMSSSGNGNGNGGNIILTSSMAGQAGIYGFSAYSPTKFALRGFAECLSMELAAKKSNINISLAYPPDTNTPGYELENRNKPEECRLISEGAGIWDAEVVGKKMVNEALSSNPTFDIYFGIDGWMLSMLTAGMNPVTSVVDAIYQVALTGLLRFVSLFYLLDFGRITQNCHDAKNTEDNSKED